MRGKDARKAQNAVGKSVLLFASPRGRTQYLHGRGAHYILMVKNNQRTLQEEDRFANLVYAPHADQTIPLTRDHRNHKAGQKTGEHPFVITSVHSEEANPEQLSA